MKRENRRLIKGLRTKRSQLVKGINSLLDTHKNCDSPDCLGCRELAELGFLYEMYSARIRELKGIHSDIDKIIHQQIKNDVLTLSWLAKTCELVGE